MNLKKAFRYQNLISDLIKSSANTMMDVYFYQENSAFHRKSDLNRFALVKNYVDETKPVSVSLSNSFSSFTRPPKKEYEAKKAISLINYLIKQKADLAEAISKAKSKIKIEIDGKTYSYDAAISYASTQRGCLNRATVILTSLTEKETESFSSEKIIVSTEQLPVDMRYTVIETQTIKKDQEKILKDYVDKTKVLVDEISDKIEVASLSAEVKFATDLPITATMDSLYDSPELYMVAE